MMSALVVVVVVLATDAQAPQTRSMTRALEGALEPGSVVVLRETASAPDDEDLAAVAGPLHADAVVSVAWSEGDGRRAHLRVQRSGRPGSTDRNIEFKPSDASVERGRAVGFAIATMLPADEAPAAVPAPPPAPRLPSPVADQPPSKPPAEGGRDRAWGLDLSLVNMGGIGGDAPGLGGDLGVRRWVATGIDIRVAASATSGRMSAAQASFTLVRPRVGVGFEVLHRGDVSVMVRLEAGPWLHAVERSSAGQTSGGRRWVAGSSASGELAWSLVPALALILGVGADVAFGTTRVLVAEDERATIPAVRIVAAGGVSLRF